MDDDQHNIKSDVLDNEYKKSEIKFNKEDEIRAHVCLSFIPGVGSKTHGRLVECLGTAERVWHASEAELQAHKIRFSWRDVKVRSQIERRADQAMRWLCKTPNAHCVLHSDFPTRLKILPDVPPLLFVLGQVERLYDPQIAVIGARAATVDGRRLAHQLARDLALKGLTLTSGLAVGIDTAVHQGALETGFTIAVLGHGLDSIYPRQNTELARRIIQQGALVSEFAPGITPRPSHFPQRNRLISGLSVGVCVVEASLRSGSLTTARWAADQGRDVFACPGSVFNTQSQGCHELLRQGAVLVESASDILKELCNELSESISNSKSLDEKQFFKKTKSTQPKFCVNEISKSIDHINQYEFVAQKILTVLQQGSMTLDDLITTAQCSASEINAALLQLELDDVIVRHGFLLDICSAYKNMELP
ncbi:MAG: DNA-processing protein DprA [Pseudomonadota bacterium]